MKRCIFIFIVLSFSSSSLCFAGQWINPKDVIGDPMIARLQQGRKELTAWEKEDIKKYGYTGLELMTYVDDNVEPGTTDFEAFERFVQVSADGNVKFFEVTKKLRYYYKDNRALLTYDGIKPGDIENKRLAVVLNPPDRRGFSFLLSTYLNSEKFLQEDDGWVWSNTQRKIRRYPTNAKEDAAEGSDITNDDFNFREPWEDDHRILGEDNLRGYNCLVVESKNKYNPNYYLSKRVTWVEVKNFLDIHEEQFDREGKLLKVIDKDWHQVKPWNYWVRWQQNYLNVRTRHRTLYRIFDFIFDQGFKDEEFSRKELEKEYIWRKPKEPLSPDKILSDLPPEPQVRKEFWSQLGIHRE